MITSRDDIKEFILTLEKKFPVNDWKVDEIHLWPYIRLKLFFSLINQVEYNIKKKDFTNKPTVKKRNYNFLYLFQSRVKKILKIINYFFWLNRLPKAINLFVSHDTYRVNYKNKRFNRFFDTLVEDYNLIDNSLFLEYDLKPSKEKYNENIIISFIKYRDAHRILSGLKKNKIIFHLPEYNEFYKYLTNQKFDGKLFYSISDVQLKNYFSKKVVPDILFFKRVLKKIAPSRIHILCYYSSEILPLVAAANKLEIATIEMQHGPQTQIHLAYSNWSNLPKSGYDMLPRTYWCWNEDSMYEIKKWADNNSIYNVVLSGNPWIKYWKNKNEDYFDEGYILYTLQPKPLTLKKLFSANIISAIKNSNFKWYIRLHPRQIKNKNKIQMYLKSAGVLSMVEIESATYDPLPQLLLNAKLHITHFSGAAIEASIFGLRTVFVNELALTSYSKLLAKEYAYFISYSNPNFEFLLNAIIDKQSGNLKICESTYPKLF